MQRLRRLPLARLEVERRAPAVRPIDAAALPAAIRVVNAAIEPLREVPHRIGDLQTDPFPVHQREEAFIRIAGVDRDVLAEPERILLVHPGVVADPRAARICYAGELWQRLRPEAPSRR